MSKAKQVGLRDPHCCELRPFLRIFEDFLAGETFRDKLFLDLGPGQCDFGALVEERGGSVVVVESDPAVVALAKHRGYPCYEGDLDYLDQLDIRKRFDGIFCKGSCNAIRFSNNPDDLDRFVASLGELLKPRGWCWVAPWNGAVQGLDPSLVKQIEEREIVAYRRHGFQCHELSEEQALHYGTNGATVNRRLFTKNLPAPPEFEEFPFAPISYPAAYLAGLVQWFARRGEWSYLTYDDLDLGEWDPARGYRAEFQAWEKSQRKKKTRHVLFQYDVDAAPDATHEVVETHLRYHVPCNVMVFAEAFDNTRDYQLDFRLLRRAKESGSGIYYHCNVWERSGFDEETSRKLFRSDVAFLREKLGELRYFSMHGGPLSPDGRANRHLDFLADVARSEGLRWVHNTRAPRFHSSFDDGGPARRLYRTRIGNPVDTLLAIRPGRRLRLLFHPQYYAETFSHPAESPAKEDFLWFAELQEDHEKALRHSRKLHVRLWEKVTRVPRRLREARRFEQFHWRPRIIWEREITDKTLDLCRKHVSDTPWFFYGHQGAGIDRLNRLLLKDPQGAVCRELSENDMLNVDQRRLSYLEQLELAYLCGNLQRPALDQVLATKEWPHWIENLRRHETLGISPAQFARVLATYLRSIGSIDSRERRLDFLGFCGRYFRSETNASFWAAGIQSDFESYAGQWHGGRFLFLVRDVEEAFADWKAGQPVEPDPESFAASWRSECRKMLDFKNANPRKTWILSFEALSEGPEESFSRFLAGSEDVPDMECDLSRRLGG